MSLNYCHVSKSLQGSKCAYLEYFWYLLHTPRYLPTGSGSECLPRPPAVKQASNLSRSVKFNKLANLFAFILQGLAQIISSMALRLIWG